MGIVKASYPETGGSRRPELSASILKIIDDEYENAYVSDKDVMINVVVSEEKLAWPLLFEYSGKVKMVSYRRPTIALSSDVTPETHWVDLDPSITLRRALEMYDEDLIAYEKEARIQTLELLILPFRLRNKQVVRVLLRNSPSR